MSDVRRRPSVAVGGVAVRDGALLLVQRATTPQAGRWTLPGGRVEPGESRGRRRRARAARGDRARACAAGRCVGWAERMGPGYHFVILDFAVDGARRTARDPVAGSDAAAVAWVPLGDVPALDRWSRGWRSSSAPTACIDG